MGFLKGFLRKAEEEIADILPGGKTGKSIRAQRKAPVAKTVSRPRDESKSWLSKDFNPVSDGINDIKSAFKYASKDWKSSENQRQVDTQNANRQILKKYTQGQLNKNQVESLVGSKVKNAGLKKKGNLYVNTVKNSTGETLLQNTGAGIMNAAPQRVIGGLAEYGGTALGNDSIRDFGTRLNQPFRDYNALAYENADNKAVAIGGNIAGNLLTLPIAPAGKAGLAYRGVVAGAPTAADTGYAIKQAGGGRVAQTIGGGATGIASGYLNSVGGDKILKPVGAVTSKLVGKTVTTKLAPTAFGRIGAGVLNEGGEEVIEQGVDNAVAKSTYDPDRKLTDNLATSFLLGGAMGGVVRGGVELGNPNTRTQLINESKVKDIANDQGGFVSGRNAKDFKQAEAEGKVFEGVDGKPRFEVSDEGAKLNDVFDSANKVANLEQQYGMMLQMQKMGVSNPEIDARLKVIPQEIRDAKRNARGSSSQKLSNVLDHPELYKQYPQLANAKVKLYTSKTPGEFGRFNRKTGTIELNKTTLADSPQEAKAQLLHEITHNIQEIEGFAKGTDATEGMDNYNRSAGEAEARAVASRMNMPMSERYVKPKPLYHGTKKDFKQFGLNAETKQARADIAKLNTERSKLVESGKVVDNALTIPPRARKRIAQIDKEIESIYQRPNIMPSNVKEKGVYLTSDKNYAETFAGKEGKILETQADVKNPYVIESKDEMDLIEDAAYYPDIIKNLESQGYDGIKAPDGQVLVFDPSKVSIGKPQPQSTFNDSLDVPKEDLIIRDGSGKAMSVEPKADPLDSLKAEARKYKSAEEFVSNTKDTPKTARVFVKSKFRDSGGYADFPIIRKVENKTLYQGGSADGRQFWTENKKYAEQFGEVTKKTGTFYEVDNGNRMTTVYVDADKQLTDLYNQATAPKTKGVAKTDPRVVDYNSKPKEGTIRLYTNTKGKNVDSILKEGLKTKQRLQGYGADPSEGSVSWFETTPNLKGYGGNTVAVDVPVNARMQKVNDTQYTVFDDLSPDNIVFVDKPLFGNYRTSDIKGLIDKYGNDKVREVFNKSKSKNITAKELDDIISATQSQPPKAPVEGKASNQGVSDRRKPVQDKVNRTEPKRTETAPKPTLQDALDGKSTKIEPKVVKTEPKIPKVAPKRTETAPKKPFIPDEIKAIRAKREANTSQQTRTDQTRKNQQALDSKSSVQSQPESKVAPRTGVQSISQAVQGRVNKISPQKARQGIGSKGRQGLLSGLSSKDTIQLSGVNVNDPFNNRKIGKRLKNEFGRYFVDEDAEMINLMKRIEKETGQKDLVETWLQDSDLVRNTNSIANSKIRRNENLKLALRGLSKKQQASFDEYASARTELSNLERGLESSSKPKEQLQQIVRDGNIDFGNRFIALNNYYGDWAKDLHDAGIISKSKLDDWSQNKDYVRVQRDMEDILNYTPPTGKSRSFGTTSTSKKRTGSTREILSPTNIALERGQQLQLEIQRNKAASNTIDTLEKYGLAEKVSQQYATGKNVVKRFKDGKVEYFATSKDVKRVIENVNPFQLGVLGRVISTPTRLFRSGTTALSAPFATTNYVRDQISSAIYSDQALPRLSKTAQGNVEYIAGTHSPKNIVSGIASATKDYFGGSSNPLWEKFEQVAGDQTQFDEMRNTRSSKATMRELRQGGKGALINKIVNPVRSMEDLIGITEKATRFQNFKGIYEAEMKRSGNEKIATQKASQAALQNSVNFTRAGKAMRVINLLLPYSNAGIQGSRNVARSFRKRPVATTMKSVAFVAVPTVLLTLMNYDDEETAKVYKNIDDTEKDDNFIIVLKGAKQNEAGSYEGIIKIPKPQGYRELTNPLRIAAERFAGNEKSGDVSKMVRDAMSAFTGPVSIEDSGKFISSLIPQAVKPTLQAIENKDYYWDSQTVPDYMIDGTDDPTKRAYKSTSGTARIIADQLGVSPILVEKFIQDTAGSVGRYGINLTDRGLNKLGIVKDDQIGGKTITGDFKRRTTEARAIEKTNKTDGQRYYDNVEKATGELPKYLQDSWKSYNTSDKNFLGEVLFEKNGQAKKQAKAAAYIEHPELFEVDKKLDKLNRKKGETGNPLYDLSYNQALIVVQEKALPPGAKDEGLNALYDQQWYSQYKNKEEKYYDKIFGKGGIEENKDNPYPERSPDLISAMDSYYDLPSSYAKGAWKKANPGIASQMEAYYSAKDAWTNTERAKLGLPPIEDRYAKYESSSGKSGSSGGSRGRSRRGSSGGSSGSRKGKFDYKFGAFAPGEIGSKKSLRKILEEAQL